MLPCHLAEDFVHVVVRSYDAAAFDVCTTYMGITPIAPPTHVFPQEDLRWLIGGFLGSSCTFPSIPKKRSIHKWYLLKLLYITAQNNSVILLTLKLPTLSNVDLSNAFLKCCKLQLYKALLIPTFSKR